MNTTREFHPVADLFPLLRGEAFQALVADIKNNGLREPIIEDAEGRILDGRNRYRACLEAGVEPRFVPWQGDGSPAALALSRNLHRRHLDESQRALVAARLARLLEAEAVQRQGRRTDLAANLQRGQDRRSSTEAAALVNVSARLVLYALRVLRDGSPELIAAVESGDMAVSTAASLARLPQADQEQATAQATSKVRALRPAPSCPGSFGRYADQPGPARGRHRPALGGCRRPDRRHPSFAGPRLPPYGLTLLATGHWTLATAPADLCLRKFADPAQSPHVQ